VKSLLHDRNNIMNLSLSQKPKLFLGNKITQKWFKVIGDNFGDKLINEIAIRDR
jgi:hypothetical protein